MIQTPLGCFVLGASYLAVAVLLCAVVWGGVALLTWAFGPYGTLP